MYNKLFIDSFCFIAVNKSKKHLLGSLSQIYSPWPSFLPSPYSTRNCVTREQETNMKCTWPKPKPRVLNANYIPLACVGACVLHYVRLVLGIIGLRWALSACVRGSRWVCEGFELPTCWYRQCELLVLGAVPNVKTQREWFCIAVEYMVQGE